MSNLNKNEQFIAQVIALNDILDSKKKTLTEMRLFKLLYLVESRYYRLEWKRISSLTYSRQKYWPVTNIPFWNFISCNCIQYEKGILKEYRLKAGKLGEWLFDVEKVKSILSNYVWLETNELVDLTHQESAYHIARNAWVVIQIEHCNQVDDIDSYENYSEDWDMFTNHISINTIQRITDNIAKRTWSRKKLSFV